MIAEPPASGTRRRLGWSLAAAGGWIGCALYLTLTASLPRSLRLGLNAGFGHLLLGVLVGGSLLCVVEAVTSDRRQLTRRALITAAATASFLVATELLQFLSDTRQPEIGDVIADATGVVAVTVTLVAAFRLGPRTASRTANGFVGVAIAGVLAVVVSTVAFPPDGPPEPATPARSADDDDCITRFRTFDRPTATGRTSAPTGDDAQRRQALALVDLAAEPIQAISPLGDIDVELEPALDTHHLPGAGVVFRSDTDLVQASGAVAEMIEMLSRGSTFTVEAWIRPATLDQGGPARIATLSAGRNRQQVNLHLGIDDDQLSVRVRTACQPSTWFEVGELSTSATHVAVAFDNGELSVFIDGARRAEVSLDKPELSGWDRAFPLSIGNETTADRAFQGAISAVAFYDWPFDDDDAERQAGARERREALDAIEPSLLAREIDEGDLNEGG